MVFKVIIIKVMKIFMDRYCSGIWMCVVILGCCVFRSIFRYSGRISINFMVMVIEIGLIDVVFRILCVGL